MNFLLNHALLSFFLILTIIKNTHGQTGTTCETNGKGTGKCTILSECPEVVELIRKQKKDYTVCSRNPLVVCCPQSETDQIRSETNKEEGKKTHEKKCAEYAGAVYQLENSFSLIKNSVPKKVDKCGHNNVPLIFGGQKATSREFPHMALIGYSINDEKQWKCGGMLISDEYVLTAAHCLKSPNIGDALYVRLGELDISRTDDETDTEDFDIIKRIPHPFYNGSFEYYDIALIQLDRKVNLNPYKRPACLPTTFEGTEQKVIVTGWGVTQLGTQANVLQKVILNKFDRNTCNEIYTRIDRTNLKLGIDEKTQFCAGSPDEKKDACSGDSGGPVQVFHPSEYCMYTLIGITSFGSGCGQPGIPGVYTRIFPFIDWIESIVWK